MIYPVYFAVTDNHMTAKVYWRDGFATVKVCILLCLLGWAGLGIRTHTITKTLTIIVLLKVEQHCVQLHYLSMNSINVCYSYINESSRIISSLEYLSSALSNYQLSSDAKILYQV